MSEETKAAKPAKEEKKQQEVIPLELHTQFAELLLKKINMKIDKFNLKHGKEFAELQEKVKAYTGRKGNFEKALMKCMHKGNLYYILRDFPNPKEVSDIKAIQQYLK